jgi:hypothetical protein
MAVVNGPQFPKLPVGKSVKVGTVTTATDILQFAMSEQSYYHSGALIIQAVPNGTVTTFTAALAMSLDGGVTFSTQTGNIGGATVASTTSTLTFTANTLQNVAIPGVGGQVSLQFQTTALTLGTATKVDIWMLVA